MFDPSDASTIQYFVANGSYNYAHPSLQGHLRYRALTMMTETSQLDKARLELIVSVADPGFPRGGDANSQGGVSTYDFARFSQKLHEIERIWTPEGGTPHAPPLDPPLIILHKYNDKLKFNV